MTRGWSVFEGLHIAVACRASDLVQGDVVARFRARQIQLGRSPGVEDFLRTQFR